MPAAAPADETSAQGVFCGEEAMHIYGPSQLHGAQAINAPHAARSAQPMARPEAAQIADEVDISEAARFIEQTRQLPDIREDRIEAVRLQIAQGTYETSDKLNLAVERLLDEIG
jgi:negative regulator of flagellin synthesis FlgM